ncbi:50S ribosomal protein L11 methyltransferase [Legionella sp. 29fVS95]|uniref:50S ribosomal protein L11 methyltransferase n=1 Tax=Legionella sp. 29fVS95 TaxID=3402813 RepID=UPI003AF83DFE
MWYQLQIEQCHRNEVELLSEALEETGALSITLTDKNDDPVLEPEPGTTPLWPDVVINALYSDEQDAEQAKQLLAPQHTHLHFSIQHLADQDWERAWMDDFKPQRFGERLWICPSWLEPPEPQAVNLILDPGLAFGTGTHPTTSLCLTWLEQADLSNKKVIDYGCGSGILALAALKLGAANVQAVDIDEQALQATRNNALTNTIEPQQLQIGFPQSLKAPADLLIANILLAPLMSLGNTFKELLSPHGLLVVSGILEEQASSLIETYQADFTHLLTHNLDGWSLLAFARR